MVGDEEHHDILRVRVLLDLLANGEAIGARHFDVEQHHVRLAGTHQPERLVGVCRELNARDVLEHVGQHARGAGIVIDNEDAPVGDERMGAIDHRAASMLRTMAAASPNCSPSIAALSRADSSCPRRPAMACRARS